MGSRASTRITLLLAFLILIALPTFAQQTGSVSGRVTGVDGGALPGVTVEARSPSLPQPRVTVSDETGGYRLPALQPGVYSITFSLAGLDTVTRNAQVLLGQNATVNVALGMALSESITVTAESTLVDPTSTEISSAVGEQQIEDLPVAQEYRDLVKLAPSVQYTEEIVRGPAAGGSGQDNVYQFDGVNVTLPLFGTLSAEPSTHDIQQVEVIKGGSKAVEFNRAAGFTIDSVSKSGTNEFTGQVGFQLESEAMRGDITSATLQQYEQDRVWANLNLGGPILRDRLFFYGSYYRPTVERTNRRNVYGELPNYDSERNEYFGKLTLTPTSNILLNGSYRASDRRVDRASIEQTNAPTTSVDEEATQDIGILEASWVINSRSFATAKFTDYTNETGSIPTFLLGVVPTTTPGTRIDVNNLDQYGALIVPVPVSGATAYNEFIAPILQRYGYTNAQGVRTGGGQAGVSSQINAQDFFRQSAQLGYDISLGGGIMHDLHVGYLWQEDAEDLRRSSNGWGVLRVPRGVNFQGQPVAYQAEFTRPIGGGVGGNNIHSEYVSHNFEINDTIRWNNFTFNVGVMASDDTLYGQGLREDSSTVSGFVSAPGNKYEMYNIPFEKTIQPRLGTTWSYNGQDNLYASYAKYVPAASSLPRAASWDRSILGLTTRVHFDATGAIIGSEQVASSSGKLFVQDLDPRYTDEFMIGTAQQITPSWSGRAYTRYRYSSNFWEDTNNNAREQWAPEGYPRDLYIPNLDAQRAQIGSGSTYVIAELDGAFTKYYEATLESDYRVGRAFVRGSYTWSHYYGNFDQDNTAIDNDMATFIGSSNIGDGPGRQIWDNKYGDLRGDRRHLLKVYGTYNLPWNAVIGAFGIYQSGQPWEAWNYEIYRTLPGFGTSTSDTARYAEPAGSRRSPAHYQVDMTYTQNVGIFRGYNLQFQLDAFNMLDNQTGYDFQPSVHSAQFGEARQFFDPRRFQLAVRFEF
ncbi:MAG TPA: carboxypeptidase regulatory-like domain-containing protein [Thermoanaerobaculia bacterium]